MQTNDQIAAKVNRLLGSRRLIESVHANINDSEGRALVDAIVREIGHAPTVYEQQRAGWVRPTDLDKLWNKALDVAHHHRYVTKQVHA
jgi:hypothetical protein